VAAFNLSRAHIALDYIGYELSGRQTASIARALTDAAQALLDRGSAKNLPIENMAPIMKGLRILENLKASALPPLAPFLQGIQTEGDLLRHWLNESNFDDLLHPMKVEYIHFLHEVVMMGVLPSDRRGRFRRSAVHVGNPDLFFPPAKLVPNMMTQYCREFPTILPTTVRYDPVLTAAKASYRFVRIHPYTDGNGRVSRLLMNLVLWSHFQPIFLKANSKGRHRYSQALRRADRGDIKPLAALIAMALRETYQRLNAALNPFHI
jgi:hypothetical protein